MVLWFVCFEEGGGGGLFLCFVFTFSPYSYLVAIGGLKPSHIASLSSKIGSCFCETRVNMPEEGVRRS